MVEKGQPVFVTGCGAFLPGEPVSGEDAERLLGCVDGRPSRLRRRVLAANGITSRHYALDEHGNTTMLNEELAARAVLAALGERGIALADVGMLAAGTTQGDVLVPGFASMVHGRLGGGPLETLSAGGVCCSGMAAFKAAAASVRLGEHPVAVAVGSELASRNLKASRYEIGERPGYDAEFLRWMLSDGAGAVVLESEPRPAGVSLRVDWVHLASYAHEHDTCMYAGTRETRTPGAGATWLDQPTIAGAEAAGLLHLRQDTRALPGLVELGVAELARLTLRGLVDPARVDHLLCHYSSEHFRPEIHRLLERDRPVHPGRALVHQPADQRQHGRGQHLRDARGVLAQRPVPARRPGPAHGPRVGPLHRRLRPPHLRGRAPAGPASAGAIGGGRRPTGPPAAASSPLGEPAADDGEVARWLLLQLALVWADFERRLRSVELVRRIEQGEVTLGEYQRLLVNLRQQVVDGGRWIARAASSMSAELFPLRSAFILHAGEEHRDYQLLEQDYLAVGGSLEEIQGASKNIGSEALSAFIFHRAGQPDPIDLLGAMFVIEGLGAAKALRWAELLQARLGLADDQVRFLRYHGVNDDDHFELLRQFLRSPAVDQAAAERIVKTAKVVARLYVLQLEELDHA